MGSVVAGNLEIFQTYRAALAKCGEGYGDVSLAAVMYAKAVQVISGDLKKVLFKPLVDLTLEAVTRTAERCAGKIRVLDFGGNFALYYFLVSQSLELPCQWAVVDTRPVVSIGRSLERDSLRFFENVRQAAEWLGSVDLVYSNAALQYLPQPEATLDELVGLGSNVLALLRCALALGSRHVTIQQSSLAGNGPGPLPACIEDRIIRYPRTFVAADKFYATLNRKFDVVGKFQDPRDPSIMTDSAELRLGESLLMVRRP